MADFPSFGANLLQHHSVIDAQALADVLGALFLEEGGNARHIAIDGKTMRASKDSEGKAEHVLSAFCSSLQTVLGHEASRSKGLEIPDALKLLERLDLRGKIVTGDAKRIKVSQQLLRQALIGPEGLVLDRLAYKFVVSQEKAFLTGSGAGRPLGVFKASPIGISTARDVATGNTTTAIGFDGLQANISSP